MKVRIVLVEPQEGGNVGAAARAMKNFGFSDIVVVGRPAGEIDEHSVWWAAGAEEMLRNIAHVATVEEALADCHITVATTAIRGRQVYEQLTPAEVASLAFENLGDEQRIALVFGREKSGLTQHEISICQRTAWIPTSPEYPTMNLAQSVAVFCYELGSRAFLRSQVAGRGWQERRASGRDLAPGDLMQALARHTREVIDEIDFFTDKRPDRICAELQALAGRAMLSTREASLLLAFVRHVQKHL